MRTAIIASRVFDGSRNLGQTTVVIGDGVIEAIGGPVPHDADVVDAQGATLLPGLIDAADLARRNRDAGNLGRAGTQRPARQHLGLDAA